MQQLSDFNLALTRIPKRAEAKGSVEHLRSTFVDSGVLSALETIDNQVVYGRRGTGKTHAMNYLASSVKSGNDFGIYADLRVLGSVESIFAGRELVAEERAARLMRDLIKLVADELLEMLQANPTGNNSGRLLDEVEGLLHCCGSVIQGEVRTERVERSSKNDTRTRRWRLSAAVSTISGFFGGERKVARGRGEEDRHERTGQERMAINFTDVGRALRGVANALDGDRVWLVLDEWSSVDLEMQPYLGEFLLRCVLPLPQFTVKIGAIQQQTRFRSKLPSGQKIGIELGADVSANLDLDHFMVFENDSDRSTRFFKDLYFKHVTHGDEGGRLASALQSSSDLVRFGFTNKLAFEELVKAAGGVPRDAINIAGMAAREAGAKKISVPNVRKAAALWYQTDKADSIRADREVESLLHWIVEQVIGSRKARGFIVNQRDADDVRLLALFEARVLHLNRRGFSAQDSPGKRFDVYLIDYGAYVDLVNTKSEPKALVADVDDTSSVVPSLDLRAVRRAILDLERFDSVGRTPGSVNP